MKHVFADTAYFLALLNSRDAFHAQACRLCKNLEGDLLTTAWVITELLDGFSRSPDRAQVATHVRGWYADPEITIVPPSQELLLTGLGLYEERPDKEWSLTDCISFVVMEREGLSDALTADRHFAQAGFSVLLK